jgi:hypothetical protein
VGFEGYIQKTRNNSIFFGGQIIFVVNPVFFRKTIMKARDGKQ